MINVGIDLHKTQFTTCVRGGTGNTFGKYPTTEEGYQAFFKKTSVWQASGETVQVGVESTGNTRYFKSRMEGEGIGVTVINTLKFKVVNESVKKTDKHDAATIAEFLEKDILPEAHLCSRKSEQMRRLLKVRTKLVGTVTVIKNQIHALLNSEGLEDVSASSLQSKRGRQRVLNALSQWENGLVVQPLVEMIERLEENVNIMEKQLRVLADGDRMVELLMGIPGCGEVCAWTIMAYTDDIKRFASAKKYAAFAGLVPWVQNSNETTRYGKITKRGPRELRTAMVQIVMGLRRLKKKTAAWRIMERYEAMKRSKGHPGIKIVAAARKIATIIWQMLTDDVAFNVEKMIDPKLNKKATCMSEASVLAKIVQEESRLEDHELEEAELEARVVTIVKPLVGKIKATKTGVAGKDKRKVS